MKTKQLEPTIAAIIMSLGIFIYGPIEAFPFFNERIGIIASVFLFLMWIVIYTRLTFTFFFKKEYRDNIFKHPIQSFAIGTWIAGASILCNVIVKYIPYFSLLSKGIAFINISIWFGFLIIIVQKFSGLFRTHTVTPVHGIILLSVVSTQSIAILITQVFNNPSPLIASSFIIIGMVLYVIGIYFLANRYIHIKNWNIIHDWKNTNCIIHGALSITGLAIVSNNGLSTQGILTLWWIIFIILILIESIEIIRMILRIGQLGLVKGILIYDVSQWARIFTFGMFYVFTSHLIYSSVYTVPSKSSMFMEQFLKIWLWILTFILILEISLYIKRLFTKK